MHPGMTIPELLKDICKAFAIGAAIAIVILFAVISLDFFHSSAKGDEVRRPKATIVYEPTATKSPGDWATNGVTPHAENKGETYTASTPEAARFVTQAVEGERDGKLHVTIIGSDDERARVVNDIKTDPSFAGLRDTLLVQDYKPGEWPVDPKLGFRAGKPAIIVQAAKGPGERKGGRVVFRCSDYSIGATGLAEAIRKADPNYRPDKDPTPTTPSGGDLPFGLTDTQVMLAIAAVVVGFLVYTRRMED
jgi:hypothetical protein